MEPMTLGSPVGSPTTPGIPGSPQSPYTPSFLLRDEFTSPQRHNNVNSSSYSEKDRNQFQASFTSNKVLNFNLAEHQKQSPAVSKTGGPPTTRLFDTLEIVNNNSNNTSTSRPFNQTSNNMNNSTFGSPSVNNTIFASDNSNSNWVTVIGATSVNQSHIIAQLSQLGNIAHISYPPKKEEKNWFYLKFNTNMEVKRVLTCNGKVYGNVMIGVLPCRDNNVLHGTTNNFNQTLNTSCAIDGFRSPLNNTTADMMASPSSNISQWRDSSIHSPRPFIHGSPNLLMSQTNQDDVPQKLQTNNGILAKTVGYFFNWAD